LDIIPRQDDVSHEVGDFTLVAVFVGFSSASAMFLCFFSVKHRFVFGKEVKS
jgi:Na+/melibiose symporter-like transporter